MTNQWLPDSRSGVNDFFLERCVVIYPPDGGVLFLLFESLNVTLENELDIIGEAAPIRGRQILQLVFQLSREPERHGCGFTHDTATIN